MQALMKPARDLRKAANADKGTGPEFWSEAYALIDTKEDGIAVGEDKGATAIGMNRPDVSAPPTTCRTGSTRTPSRSGSRAHQVIPPGGDPVDAHWGGVRRESALPTPPGRTRRGRAGARTCGPAPRGG
jgi:hypothetical protein